MHTRIDPKYARDVLPLLFWSRPYTKQSEGAITDSCVYFEAAGALITHVNSSREAPTLYNKHFRLSVKADTNLANRVLESIKAGKRLPEAQFSNISIAGKNQRSVYGMFKKTDPKSHLEGPDE